MTARTFVIDTNVLVAGLLTTEPRSPTARVLDAMLEGRLVYLLSPELLREVREVLLRPRIARRHGLTQSEIDRLLTELTANALWREPQTDPGPPPPDPQDAHLWALLASEPRALLVTGDRLLLENPRPGTSVITPAAWTERFAALAEPP